jgi:hypothetical protein
MEQMVTSVSRSFQGASAEFTENASLQWRDTAAMVENAVRSFMFAMRVAVAEAGENLERLAQASLQTAQGGQEFNRNAEGIVRALSADIHRINAESGRYIERLLAERLSEPRVESETVERRLDTLVSRLNRDLDSQVRALKSEMDTITARAMFSADRSQVQGLVQQLDNTLNRLESLQILARSAPGPDGQQQIVSIPVRIGDEWTDMTVRLIRKRRPHAKREREDFSVLISISPTFLGAIEVRMEYARKRDLGVNISFERGATRAWFDKNREEFLGAIQALGFKNVHFSFRRITPSALPQFAAPASTAGGTTTQIDVNA